MRVLDPVDASSDNVAIGVGGAETILTLLAVEDKGYVIGGVAWSYSDTPTAGGLEMYFTDSSSVVFSVNITSGGPGHLRFDRPLRFPKNKDVLIKLEAPGGAVVGKVNATSTWLEN